MGADADDVPLDPREEALVRVLMPAIRELQRRMDDDLRPHGLSSAEYLVLMSLSEADGRRLSLSELASSCHQSLSAISRTVGRLEANDWVVRERSSSDARSAQAVLTDAGLAHLHHAWPAHLRTVRHSLLDHLEGLDLTALTAAFEAVAGRPSRVPEVDPPDVSGGSTSG